MPRGSSNPEVVTIFWRDIPAQVNAQRGRERQQVVLPEKFERAIDRAKRKAKIVTAHEDVAQWRRVSRPCGDDLAAEAEAEAATLIAAYSAERLGKLGFAGGFAQDVDAASAAGSSTDGSSTDGSSTDGEDDEPLDVDALPAVSHSFSFAAEDPGTTGTAGTSPSTDSASTSEDSTS